MEFTGQLDTSEVNQAIENTHLNLKTILSSMTKAVNRQVLKQAKANYTNQYNSKNHNYRYPDLNIRGNFKQGISKRNYSVETLASGQGQVVGYVMNKVFYSLFLEHGADIYPRHPSGYLTFKINGEFKKVKSVTIPAGLFTKNALLDFWNSEKFRPYAEGELMRQLNKYWNKGGSN